MNGQSDFDYTVNSAQGRELHKRVLIYARRYGRKEAGLGRQIDAQDNPGAQKITRITNRHAKNHFDAALRLNPFTGAETDTTRAHVFGISHQPAAGADAPEFNGQFEREGRFHVVRMPLNETYRNRSKVLLVRNQVVVDGEQCQFKAVRDADLVEDVA